MENNKDTFETATDKLIILAKKGSVQIVIPIHETLMEILKSENPTNCPDGMEILKKLLSYGVLILLLLQKRSMDILANGMFPM